MISDNDLKPCPCCNGKARFQVGGELYTIVCIDCHIETDTYDDPNSLAMDWNRRPEVDDMKKLLGECHKRFKQYDMDNAEPDMTPYVHTEFMKKLEATLGS